MAIKRIREILDKDQVQANKARLGKEIKQLRKDYEFAREQNGELYDLVEAEEHDTLDQWENDLANDVFSIEEEVEVSLITLEQNQVNMSGSVGDSSHASNTSGSVGESSHASNTSGSVGESSHASNTSSSVGDRATQVTQVVLWGMQITQVTQTILLERLVMQVTRVTQIVLSGTQFSQMALMYRQIPRSSPFLPRI